MSLLDACLADVRESSLVEMELQGLQSGSSTTEHCVKTIKTNIVKAS